MDFVFKDGHSKELFQKYDSGSKDREDSSCFLNDVLEEEEVEVISSLNVDELEGLLHKSKVETKEVINEIDIDDSLVEVDMVKELEIFSQDNSEITSRLQRIESKQNAMLEILEQIPIPTHKEIELSSLTLSDEDTLLKNLEIFNARLTLLSFDTIEDSYIKALLEDLDEVSQYLYANSFQIFSKENSPIKKALEKVRLFGVGSSALNREVMALEELLLELDSFSKMDIFQKSYSFANLLLEKGLFLNAITIFNEATGIYIVESVKGYSKEIAKYTYLIGEEDVSKLYSKAKDFFDALFSANKKSMVPPFYPNHKIVKDIDKEIARKLTNIHNTLSKKGDGGLFVKYTYVTSRIRYIRNSTAHADMDKSFRLVKDELKSLSDDLYYLAITKNILKR